MKKSIAFIGTLLIAASLCACNQNNENVRSYPDIDPVFTFSFKKEPLRDESSLELEHFIVGNTYTYAVELENASRSFIYADDISFAYDASVFKIEPYYTSKFIERTFAAYFVIDVKAASENNNITISHLGKVINTIDLPIVPPTKSLSYYRFDSTHEMDYEQLEGLVGKATVIKSKTELDSYGFYGSNTLRSSVDNASFFEGNNLVYVIVRKRSSAHYFEDYFVENNTVYFRVTDYRTGSDLETMDFDSLCTIYTIVIDKTDGDTFTTFDIWTNSRLKK